MSRGKKIYKGELLLHFTQCKFCNRFIRTEFNLQTLIDGANPCYKGMTMEEIKKIFSKENTPYEASPGYCDYCTKHNLKIDQTN